MLFNQEFVRAIGQLDLHLALEEVGGSALFLGVACFVLHSQEGSTVTGRSFPRTRDPFDGNAAGRPGPGDPPGWLLYLLPRSETHGELLPRQLLFFVHSRRIFMAPEERETVSLIGSDKVEGTVWC